MRKYLYWFVFVFFFTATKVFCASEQVSPELSESLKTNASEPNVFSIFGALLFVIVLIYVTGVIYSKLNIAGASAIRKQVKQYDLSRAIVLSTTQLGQGKNLHVIELHKKKYLIGAAQNSITLLKELDDKDFVNQNEIKENRVQSVKVEEPEINIVEEKQDDFDVHKKYL